MKGAFKVHLNYFLKLRIVSMKRSSLNKIRDTKV